MKKTICILVILTLLMNHSIPVFATSSEENDTYVVSDFRAVTISDIGGMNITQLNAYIHEAATSSYMQNIENSTYSTTVNASEILSRLWYAAGRIAYLSGYRCAGTIVMHSALGTNYSETNGLLSTAIIATEAFSKWKSNYTSQTSFSIEKTDSSDLFYALHSVTASLSASSQGGTAHISDIFDFDVKANFGSLFSNLINDWGWLSQRMGALTAISITITITL